MTDLVRSASLTNYAEVARSVGIDPFKMLRKVGLPLACLGDQDMRIPVSGVRRLLEASSIAAGVEEFGLLMAERDGFSHLGPVALVVREQATVGLAIEALSRFVHLHNEAVRLNVERRDDVVIMALFLRGRRPRAPRQAAEMTLGTLYRVLRYLFGGDWRPLEVHLMRSPPRNLRFYRRFFGCKVIFDSDFNGIVCPAIDMDRPIPTADPLMARYVQGQVEAMRSQSWEDKVSEIVRSLMPNGQCTIERVAQHLGCNRRTIHRHLFDNGTNFSEILDTQRADLATRLIEDSNRPLVGIAELLGFSAQSAMARWFRGRFGCTLTQWRTGIRPETSAKQNTRASVRKRRTANKLERPALKSRRLKNLAR